MIKVNGFKQQVVVTIESEAKAMSYENQRFYHFVINENALVKQRVPMHNEAYSLMQENSDINIVVYAQEYAEITLKQSRAFLKLLESLIERDVLESTDELTFEYNTKEN